MTAVAWHRLFTTLILQENRLYEEKRRARREKYAWPAPRIPPWFRELLRIGLPRPGLVPARAPDPVLYCIRCRCREHTPRRPSLIAEDVRHEHDYLERTYHGV
jgi:hypothetical protein